MSGNTRVMTVRQGEHALADAFGIAALDQLPAASINDAIEWVGSQGGAA